MGLEVRTKRLDVTPELLNRLRQPGADMGPSAAMTASLGAVTPGSTSTTWFPLASRTIGRSTSGGGRLLLLGALLAEDSRL